MPEQHYLVQRQDGIWLRQPIPVQYLDGMQIYFETEAYQVWEISEQHLYILFWPPCGVFLGSKKGSHQFFIKLKTSPTDLWLVENNINGTKDVHAIGSSLAKPAMPHDMWLASQTVVDDLSHHQKLVKERDGEMSRHVHAYRHREDAELANARFKRTVRAAQSFLKRPTISAETFRLLLSAFGYWGGLSDEMKKYLVYEVSDIGGDGTVIIRNVGPIDHAAIADLAKSLRDTVAEVHETVERHKLAFKFMNNPHKKYLSPFGGLVYVSSNLHGGNMWAAVCRDSRETRVVEGNGLAPRATRVEAQRDLDAYAEGVCWKPYYDEG